MPTIEELKTRAARFKALSAKFGEKKDTEKARQFKKLMKRVQRKALPLKAAANAVAAAAAKAKAAEAKPAEAAEAKS